MTTGGCAEVGFPIQRGGADLHSHTTASDGMELPRDNVRLAHRAGLEALAVTDHDTVAGIAEAMAEANKLGIHLVPGVEISTVEAGVDIHVLGYYVNDRDPVLLERLSGLRRTRDRRNVMMTDKLTELGIPITMEEVVAELGRPLADGETVGRPHIADALVRRGVVQDMREAFDKYLGARGAAYVNPPRIRPHEAADWIRDAGGAVVLAHPVLYGSDELVERIVYEMKPDGIEVWHSDHDEQDVQRYTALAQRFNCIMTAGSDFHGARQGKVFHGQLGSRRVSMDTVNELYQIAERRRLT
ncbi:PHP domain-containing protein [Paenibacillus sp. ACRRX]|uniref:PHP domain-containing protein n=1 Tax=Paenibacillus sp. ACRRX TaxID=2918206 RepID=UPI001EF46677|nr:PHP domain-containing protein [Paenibacillus sp. ACRRX]MCG7407614.1 PHP domain-containing protein [Paenibacillus sp. ACRRX]